MYLGQQVDKIIPGNVGIGGANMGQVPLFSVQWCPSRTAIWAGYVAADGQELDTSLYPDAFAGIQAGNVPTVAAATWISTPAERGKYVQSSSAGKMRVPDYNGRAAGSLGALFLRGDGALSAATAGAIQSDAFQGHWHNLHGNASQGSNVGGADQVRGGSLLSAVAVQAAISDGVNGTPRTASETRPLNVTGCWVIKLFGQVTNPGRADAAQLATAYADMVTRIGTIEDAFNVKSLASNGYQKLPSGLIIQWATVAAANATAAQAVSFPLAFPNAALQVVNQIDLINDAAGNMSSYSVVSSLSPTAVTFRWTTNRRFIAIGY